MVTIAIALLIIACVAVVAYPFFANGEQDDVALPASTDPVVENMIVTRDATYAAIKELEFDHAMGKLSDADYKMMRARYETKAVAILQQLDELHKARGNGKRAHVSDDDLEQEVLRLRRETKALTCPKCGTPHSTADAFCAKCGTPLRGVRCPDCGTRAAVGDKFCPRCGSRLGAPVRAG